MAPDLAGIGTHPFDMDGPPLRRKALAGLILVVALPIPLVSASGLSLPLPGFVERMAVALADGVASTTRQHSSHQSRHVTIARTAAERALATRAVVAPAPTPTPASAAVHHAVARKSSAAVAPVRPSDHVAASTRRVAVPAVKAAAVVAPAVVAPSATGGSASQAKVVVVTPSVSRAADPAPAATLPTPVSTDTRVGEDVHVDPVVPIVPVVPVAGGVVGAVAPVVPVVGPVVGSIVGSVVSALTGGLGLGGLGNLGGSSGTGGSSGHGNGGSSHSGDDSGPGNGSSSGKGKAGTSAESG